MSAPAPVAFYAPLKPPDHPSPSGDRTMARLLLKALAHAGFSPLVASDLRTHDGRGDAAFQKDVRHRSLMEAEHLTAHYQKLPPRERPALWFTYHVYYKAPDWIGPDVAQALRIPYVVAEGSRATKRAGGPWALSHRGAEQALDRAALIFTMTSKDRPALLAAKPDHQTLIDLPPFIDHLEWDAPPAEKPAPAATPRLLAVAMMRSGDKLESYRILADALKKLQPLSWTLDIAGDGEARAEVERLFAPFSAKVRFHGACERDALRALYDRADLFVWPAVNEAYGMVFLEAQLFSIPVVAGAFGGVSSVVMDGRTGTLTKPGDADDFAHAVGVLLADAEKRRDMGHAARAFILRERTLDGAASRLRTALTPLIEDFS